MFYLILCLVYTILSAINIIIKRTDMAIFFVVLACYSSIMQELKDKK